MNDDIDTKLDQLSIWIEANRDVPPQKWEDEIWPMIKLQIKAAFKEAGYIQIPTAHKLKGEDYIVVNGVGPVKRVDGAQLMTGQEWLARFEKELPDTPLKTILPSAEIQYKRSRVLDAARRAAGLK